MTVTTPTLDAIRSALRQATSTAETARRELDRASAEYDAALEAWHSRRNHAEALERDLAELTRLHAEANPPAEPEHELVGDGDEPGELRAITEGGTDADEVQP